MDKTKNGYILVTGGAGLIGLNLAHALTECGRNVILFDKRLPLSTGNVRNAVWKTGDIRDETALQNIFNQYPIRGLIHLAAVSRVIDAEENPETCWDVNVSGTKTLLNVALSSGYNPWLIYGSSREVYGESKTFPIKESDNLYPVNIYGKSKVAGEEIVKEYSKSASAPAIALRFSNVYGSNFDHRTRVIPSFINNVLNDEPMKIEGMQQFFDFTYISDTVDGIIKTIHYLEKHPKCEFFDAIHILKGESHSLEELSLIVASNEGKTPYVDNKPPRSYDVKNFYGDPQKATDIIGFKAKVSLKEGIRKTFNEYKKDPLRVLIVIHGYPPYYMAGSEVYSYHLARQLVREGHEVAVFTRVENPFDKPYSLEDSIEDGVFIRRINNPERNYTLKENYENENVSLAYEDFLGCFKPDIVHIGHLSHLSSDIVTISKRHHLPIVFTLHDFWLFCFRGQMIDTDLNICNGPNKKYCMGCLRQKFKEHAFEEEYEIYRQKMDGVIKSIDHFIAPSEHIRDFFIEHGVSKNKITHLRYGFETEKIEFQRRFFDKNSEVVIGYTGRIIPSKGIRILIDAFHAVKNPNVKLKLFGGTGSALSFLKPKNDDRVTFYGEYHTDNINDVLSKIDVLVVPSLWYEVSPLVIQEAFLAGKPVITSELGGMKELVEDGINGFKIPPGDLKALQKLIQNIANNPTILNDLTVDPTVTLPISNHTEKIMEIYRGLL